MSPETESKFERALFAIVLASDDAAPQVRDCYNVILSPGWPGMACGGMGSTESFPVWVPPRKKIDPDLIKRAFSSLSGKLNQLRPSLNKLQSSRRRQEFLDSIVDLGTCIEMLLMHGSKDNNEITYKLATRAAWLLGEDGSDRVEIFEIARRLYSARSKVVHSGTPPDTKGGNGNADDLLRPFDALCKRLVLKIASLDAWPDWVRLVLGASQSGTGGRC